MWNQYRLLCGDDEVMKSIIQETKRSILDGSTIGLHEHHLFKGRNRNNSEKYGLKVWLTFEQHEFLHGKDGHELDMKLMRLGQAFFELNHTRKEFMSIFGRNYLD